MAFKSLPFGLTSSAIVAVLAAPFAAYAQFSPIQNAEQSVTIRGDNNTVNQRIDQTIIFQPPTLGSGIFSGSHKKYKKPKLKNYGKKVGKYGKKYWKKGKDYVESQDWRRGWERDDDDWERNDDDDDD